MKPHRCCCAWLAAFCVSIMLPLLVSAHPGHDHGDIPSVIRHPFIGIEHVVITAVLLVAAVGAAVLAVRAWHGSSEHGARARTGRIR